MRFESALSRCGECPVINAAGARDKEVGRSGGPEIPQRGMRGRRDARSGRRCGDEKRCVSNRHSRVVVNALSLVVGPPSLRSLKPRLPSSTIDAAGAREKEVGRSGGLEIPQRGRRGRRDARSGRRCGEDKRSVSNRRSRVAVNALSSMLCRSPGRSDVQAVSKSRNAGGEDGVTPDQDGVAGSTSDAYLQDIAPSDAANCRNVSTFMQYERHPRTPQLTRIQRSCFIVNHIDDLHPFLRQMDRLFLRHAYSVRTPAQE